MGLLQGICIGCYENTTWIHDKRCVKNFTVGELGATMDRTKFYKHLKTYYVVDRF
jgi:hypothetical protein